MWSVHFKRKAGNLLNAMIFWFPNLRRSAENHACFLLGRGLAVSTPGNLWLPGVRAWGVLPSSFQVPRFLSFKNRDVNSYCLLGLLWRLTEVIHEVLERAPKPSTGDSCSHSCLAKLWKYVPLQWVLVFPGLKVLLPPGVARALVVGAGVSWAEGAAPTWGSSSDMISC